MICSAVDNDKCSISSLHEPNIYIYIYHVSASSPPVDNEDVYLMFRLSARSVEKKTVYLYIIYIYVLYKRLSTVFGIRICVVRRTYLYIIWYSRRIFYFTSSGTARFVPNNIFLNCSVFCVHDQSRGDNMSSLLPRTVVLCEGEIRVHLYVCILNNARAELVNQKTRRLLYKHYRFHIREYIIQYGRRDDVVSERLCSIIISIFLRYCCIINVYK